MPFKSDLDRTPIDVLADKYVDEHAPALEHVWDSIISVQVEVPASVTTLAELLLAVETTETAEVVEVGATGVSVYSGTVAPHPHMKIIIGEFDITIPVVAGDVEIADQGDGTLANGADVGTIDYETGEWTITCDSTVEDGENILATYDWGYMVDPLTPAVALWLAPTGAADAIFATYSPDGTPAADAGILLSEAIFLSGQPNLIENAKFFGDTTLMDVEVLI